MQGLTRRWRIQDPPESTQASLLERVLAARGMDADRDFLNPAAAELHDAASLPGARSAAAYILEALDRGERIAIYGDYDVDGLTATATLWHVLRSVAPDADILPYIPHRLEEGYGLNSAALDELHAKGVSLVITVDCGVTAIDAAAHAASIGLALIITDHHLVHEGEPLPEAVAIVHPALPGTNYAWPELSGSAVAWKLARALVTVHQGRDDPVEPQSLVLRDTLCLAAMGVIADVMPLTGENRRIVAKGLRIMHTCGLPGVQAMLQTCLRQGESLESETVAFRIGPRINAAGRLGHAQEALDILCTDDADEARRLAASLTAVNTQRQELVREIEKDVKERVEARGMDRDDHRVIVLHGEDWHPGVIGIVCSRMVERFHRPVVLVCGDGDVLKGSARSISTCSIHDALSACDAHLEQWGGHHMAAGLQMRRENFDDFARDLCATVNAMIGVDDLVGNVTVDVEARRSELSPSEVRTLDTLRPFGRGNPSPRLLLRDQPVERVRTMGKHSAHLELVLGELRAVWWGEGRFESTLPRGIRVDVVGRVEVDVWNDRERVQVIIDDVRPC